MKVLALTICLMASAVNAQGKGELTREEPIQFTISDCNGGSCSSESGALVMDSNWRWTHANDGATNCYTGNEWDPSLCPDPDSCTSNCAIDGVSSSEWTGTYGITGSGNQVEMKFKTQGPYSTNIGSRMFFLDSSKQSYKVFNLLNQEFTFTVDVSNLECGLNGALYFVEMDADGGLSEYPTNEAGAAYGTGYCDAQCPHDVKWINGEANSGDWVPSSNDVNAGKGHYGTCCAEMDIWEANKYSQAYTTHPCNTQGQYRCEGTECGDNDLGERYDGVCDKDGCDFASYRMGDQTFYGPGLTVDTNQPVTVVTQFITDNGQDNGNLVEIRRLYVQNGNVIQNSKANFAGLDPYDSITEDMCQKAKQLFGDYDDHAIKGGLAEMGRAIGRGMVLTISMWDDHEANMLWLDSNYPTEADPSQPGIARGPCPNDSGRPEDVEANQASATVKFSDIKYGPLDSTY